MTEKMVVVHMRATKPGVDLRHMVGVAQGMTQEELEEQGVWLEEEVIPPLVLWQVRDQMKAAR